VASAGASGKEDRRGRKDLFFGSGFRLGLFSPANPTTSGPDERIGRIAAGACHFYGSSGHKVYAFTPDGTGHAIVAIFSGISDIEVGANDQLFIVDLDQLYTVTSGCETCPN